MTRLRLVPLILALAAPPCAAQLGYTGPEGLFMKLHTVGGGWGDQVSTGWDRLKAGQVGSGSAIDLLVVRHAKTPLHLQVRAGGRWLPVAEPGAPAGLEGAAITGLKLKADGRAIRYRASFGGRVTEWESDGAACEGSGGLDALDVELLDAAPRGSPLFEYRVFFAGSGFTPWLKAGEIAEGKGPKPAATGLEVRGGGGLKIEVRMQGGSWGPTVAEGELAGDPKGVDPITSIRVIQTKVPIRYRVKVQGSGWGIWQNGGDEAAGAGGLRLEAIQLDLKPAPK